MGSPPDSQSNNGASTGLGWQRHNVVAKDSDEGNRPPPRSCHTMTVIGTNAYLFGGMTHYGTDEIEDTYDVRPSGEMYKLNLASKLDLEFTRLNIPGPSPLPRWRHTATLFESTQILIFGGFHNTDHRLNDVWVFDTISNTWTQPNPKHNQEAAVSCQLANNEWTNVPPPRAGHSATLIGENVYIFGGYGGLGYGRRDLDDVFALNVYTWQWSKITPKGAAPEKRSGHQAVAVEKKIYIFGGSNSAVQFQDVFILDTECDPPLWSKMSITLSVPTWNQSACSVIAIPTWKIFTFGGITGPLTDNDRMGKPVNTIAILDTGVGRWQYPKIEGKSPICKSDATMVYDPKGSRLIIYGGWADEWLSDIYSLDVGNIVGPPYAIIDMYPSMGPVTGGTEVTIVGIDFINTTNIVVRFGNPRTYIDVQGVYVSQSKITCISPVSKFQGPEVEVRVSLEGDSFTTTFQKFTYFPVTNYRHCVMYGPGLLSGCCIHEEVSFIIQAKDDIGQNRTTGGDEFSVIITMIGAGPEGEDVRLSGVIIDDLQNGRYTVSYKAKFTGKYCIRVDFLGTFGGKAGELRGSGVIAEFVAKAPKENNQMGGQLVINSLKADIESLAQFTDEMSRTVLVKLKDDSWSSDEQIQVLMKIKEALITIENKTEEITLKVDRSESLINYLLEENVVLGALEESLHQSKYLWEKILRESPQIQNKIAPMMRSHNSKIKSDIVSYEHQITSYKSQLTKADFYLYATGYARSIQLIEEAQRFHREEQEACAKMTHVANIFDCLREMDNTNKAMREVEDLLSDFKFLWETNHKVVTTVEDAKKIIWKHLDAEELEDSAKALVLSLRKLPKTVRTSDAYIGLDRAVKEFVITCPIITSLRSPSMRERHWKELMGVVKHEFTLPSEKPNMELKNLLELNLHLHAADVDEITEKANKEAKHEDTLRSLENTWSQVSFTMQFYKDTDVPLIKMEDESVEQLESDQMAVQSIVGSRYAFFKPQAIEWQKSLGFVSDVYQLLSEIQRTWSYLEPLFIGSEEVKKELPEDANRFREIDMEVRSILQRAWKLRKVKVVCTQAGLLDKLMDLEKQQEKCKKSLSDFLDGKRRQFPRFYFMSEADLLTLLSNSSSPGKVLALVSKSRFSNLHI